MNKLRFFSLNLLLFVAVSLSAVDFTTSYYTSANGKKGEALKTALYNIIKNPSVTSYDGLYTGYKKTDNRVINGTTYVRDWYSTTTRYKHVTDKAGSYSKEGDCYNREHSVPQSWFGSGSIKSDIVHVLPTDGYVNNRRGNYPFGEVGTATYTSNGGYCKLGSAKSGLGYSGTVFEPADEIKGDLARIYFYMATCYQDKCTSWGNNVFTGTTYSPLSSWSLQMFMRWSEQDPVDDIEIARNNAVQDVQGNRNPFVDFPGLEQYVWGTLKTTAISVTSYDNPYDTSGLTTPTFNFNGTNVVKVLGDAAFQYQATTNSDATIQYASSNTNVATVSSNGTVTIKAVGTTTISARVAQTSTYKAASASYLLTVKASADDPTESTGDYVKVTTAPSDWSGTYLIVCEDGGVALDGGLSTLDAASNTISVTISDNTIASNSTTDAASFTIAAKSGGYSILSASGLYMGQTSDANGLKSGALDTYTNAISLSGSDATIVSGGAYLRYNPTSGQTRFRYFKSATYEGQKAIQLYKKSEGSGTGDDPTPAGPVDPTVSFGTSALTLSVGETVVNEADTNSDGLLTYSSSNQSVATVDLETGLVTALREGTTTITATVSATDNYNQGSASYTLTVTASGASTLTGSGTLNDPYTVADVLQLFADNNVPTSAVYVKGIVSQIKSLDVSKYTRAQYYISDDGTTTNQFYVYNGLYLDGANFTSNDQLQVADQVVVNGTLTTYNTTNEFAQNSKIVSLVRPSSGPVAPTVSFATASKTLAVGATYTQTLTTNSDGAVTYTSSAPGVATVNAQTGLVTAVAAGTATITASVAATSAYTAATATYTVTVTAAGGSTRTDELTATVLGLTGNYSDVTGKTAVSGTVYAANAMTDADKSYIQMRSNNNNSGIVSTATVGTVAKVTVDWATNTQSGRVLNIYGSNTAYTSPADLYNTSKQGTLLGTIVYGTSTELTVTGDYAYIGIRSNSGALYAAAINIVWNVTSGTLMNPSASFEESTVTLTVGDTFTQTVETNSDGAVTYRSSDPAVATVDASTGLVTAVAAGTATITADIAATSTYNAAAPTYTVTVVAAEQPLDYSYVKVTSEPTDWSGTYLIVNEEAGVALDGSRETLNAASGQSNCITVTIEEDQIAATTYTAAAEFTVAKLTDGYSIQAASGGYLGLAKGKSGMDTSAEAIANTLAYHSDGDSVTIACTSVVTTSGVSTDTPVRLCFNPNNGTPLFRYYSYSTQLSTLTLYKKVTSGEEPEPSSGDVNKDGNVSIADVTALVNIVLGKDSSETPVYDHEAADVNGDGQVTIADVTALVNVVLGKTL